MYNQDEPTSTEDERIIKELTRYCVFEVQKAEYHTVSCRTWDGFVGPGSHSTFTGTYPKVILNVTPENLSIPVTELEFRGHSFIQSGDKIRAEIKKYEEIDRGLRLNLKGGRKLGKYEERNFKEKESTSLIEKLGLDNEILATFRGLD